MEEPGFILAQHGCICYHVGVQVYCVVTLQVYCVAERKVGDGSRNQDSHSRCSL